MRIACLLALLVALFIPTGCFHTRITVGDGPQGKQVTTDANWYAGWGFIRLGSFDPRQVVGANRNFRVTTRMGAFDVFANIFLFPFSVLRSTTVVEE